MGDYLSKAREVIARLLDGYGTEQVPIEEYQEATGEAEAFLRDTGGMIKAHPATISDETLAAIRRNVNKAAEAQDRAAAGQPHHAYAKKTLDT